jgi:hypothetical protein
MILMVLIFIIKSAIDLPPIFKKKEAGQMLLLFSVIIFQNGVYIFYAAFCVGHKIPSPALKFLSL